MRKWTWLAATLVALGGSGCALEDFDDPGYRVTKLRVLAVRADRPFAAPGERVQLSALSHDPASRPITWVWAVCVNPATSDVVGCLTSVSETARAGAAPFTAVGVEQDTFELEVPPNALEVLPETARPAALVGVVSVACPGELDFEPGPARIPARCLDATSGAELPLADYVVGLKRIFVRQSDRNDNPTIERVTFDGVDWPPDEVKEVDACDTDDNDYDACDRGKHSIAAWLTPDSFETGTDELGRAYSENLVVQYYATEGIFENEVRIAEQPETGWVARSAASGRELSLWLVARDDRGGVTWTDRRVRVR